MKKKYLHLNSDNIEVLRILNTINIRHKYLPHKLKGARDLYLAHELIEPGNEMKGYTDFFKTLKIVEIPTPEFEKLMYFPDNSIPDSVWRKYMPFVDITNTTKIIPDYLFHYTNSDGLLGMLQSNKIWATHYNFMSDIQELEYCRNLIVEIFLSLNTHKSISLTMMNMTSLIDRYIELSDIFFISFSTQPDDLGMWGNYSEGGRGYSIKFSAKEIGLQLPPSSKFSSKFVIAPIIYDKKMQNDILSRKILHAFELLIVEDKIKPLGNYFWEKLISEIVHKCWIEILTFKSNVFQNENEYRIIARVDDLHLGSERIKFRSRNNVPLPYIEVDISPNLGDNAHLLPITEVICGPRLDEKFATNGVRKLLTKYRRMDLHISRSSAHLR